jgi:chromate transporter
MVPLTQLALTFLKIGAFGFGGPFSLLAIMEKETVERRKWLTAEDFTQSVGIGTLTPGPIFFAATVYIGLRLRGIPGAVVCGLCSLLPSFILVLAIAALYVELQTSLLVMAIVHGISVGVIGLFVSVVIKTGRSTMKDLWGAAIVMVAFILLALFKADPLVLIVSAAVLGGFLLQPKTRIQKPGK